MDVLDCIRSRVPEQSPRRWEQIPIPPAYEATKNAAALIVTAAMAATPFLMMQYFCDLDSLSLERENMRRCFHKPSQFFLPPLMVGALVGLSLNEARNLCYRTIYRIEDALCKQRASDSRPEQQS